MLTTPQPPPCPKLGYWILLLVGQTVADFNRLQPIHRCRGQLQKRLLGDPASTHRLTAGLGSASVVVDPRCLKRFAFAFAVGAENALDKKFICILEFP